MKYYLLIEQDSLLMDCNFDKSGELKSAYVINGCYDLKITDTEFLYMEDDTIVNRKPKTPFTIVR